MELTTRVRNWGVEIENDTIKEDIYTEEEAKETIINFLEATKDLSNLIKNANQEIIQDKIEDLINLIENLK